MLYDVINAEYCNDYQLKVVFENGVSGIIDFSKYLELGGVFENFKNLVYFKNFKVSKDLGTIVWDNEVDIAPDTLYYECINK